MLFRSVAAAKERGSYVVDSVCPLVTKVHHEVKVRAGKGFRIVYVGHEGHEEAVGTMAVAPHAISRVESIAEVEALPQFDEPVALLREYIAHRYTRERQILSALASGPATVDALVTAVHPTVSKALRPVAGESVLAHLIKLEREERVGR